MEKYILSPAADKDIEEIALYTLENWGENQTTTYLNDLKSTFEKISASPHLGRERKDIKKNVYSCLHQQHAIYYQRKGETLVVLRVLHQSRDVHSLL